MSFWANKLTNQPVQPVAPTTRELFPTLAPYTTQAPQPQAVPATQSYTPTVRMTQGSICPGCGNTSYRATIGERAVSCPACGYHPRFEQTGYGTSSLRGEKPAPPARQIMGTQTMQNSIAVLNAGGGDHITAL